MNLSSGPTSDGSEPRSRPGLRLRLYAGGLLSVLVAVGGAVWAVFAATTGPNAIARDLLLLYLGITAVAAVMTAIVVSIWLDRGIRSRLHRLLRSVRVLDPTPLNDPFGAGGWGELADLSRGVSGLLTRHRQAMRAADQFQDLERQLEVLQKALDQWVVAERWPGLPAGTGSMVEVARSLDRGFRRLDEIGDQNREAARQIHGELAAAVQDARETAEQAERGFVEGTALLTTLRELQRLGVDFPAVREPAAAKPASGDWMTPVSEALSELVTASSESVDHLASGLAKVQEIADHVNVLGNRSTLVALNALMAMPREEGPAESTELKDLAREARVATDRVQELAREVAEQVRSATERMAGVRERVGSRLANLEQPPVAQAAPPDFSRQVSRIREMVQDATRKTERLSTAGERASRAADRLVRRLDESVRDVEGMVVRLSPPGGADVGPSAPPARRFTVIDPTAGQDENDNDAKERW